ncbi:MAG TPA: phospholipid carrier-dependent glycosyltransferase, partial [Thermoanaerobaculia bacterium]|nr:phospholipid carrier-dependent glycosyltransferase [Thermoanaerobaculia bacterium]
LFFALATIALTGWFGALLFGRTAGYLAAFITAASPLAVAFSRVVIFDSTLTFFIVLAIVAFERAVSEDNRSTSRRWALLAWVAIALGVLTKGPVAIAVPLMVALPFGIRCRRSSSLFTLPAIFTFALIIAAWVVPVSMRIPDFLKYVVVTETFKRLTTNELKRTAPPWYFIPIFLGGTFPWSVVLLTGLRRLGNFRDEARRIDRRLFFLLLWLIVPLVFFSISQSKRPQYILPVVPAAALLVAFLWTSRSPIPALTGRRAAAMAMAVIGLLFVVFPLVYRGRGHVPAELLTAAKPALMILGVTMIASGIAALSGRGLWLAAIALGVPIFVAPVLLMPVMQAVGRIRSTRELVSSLPSEKWAKASIISVRTYEPSLSFYVRKPVTIATRDANELRSNYAIRHFDAWLQSGQPGLRSLPWWGQQFEQCHSGEIFTVGSHDTVVRSMLARRLPLIRDTTSVAAYGPCTGQPLAASTTATTLLK